ncbi:MAG TPA: hypothetical protein VFN35_21035 [Ktedonobacteraceae bacterium]|nr:hypothetical protein [Ktedonobacteraceae bacterium]
MSEPEARDPATSTERLEELSHDPALRVFVASNPAAPALLLETLATDPDAQVRAAVASNPNAFWPTLEDLSWEFPRAFLHNPLGPIHLVAHPEQISTDGMFKDNLFREASIPPHWWAWLTNQPSNISEDEDNRIVQGFLQVHYEDWWDWFDSPTGWSPAASLHIQQAGETSDLYGLSLESSDVADILQRIEMLTAATVQGAQVPDLVEDFPCGPIRTSAKQLISAILQSFSQSTDPRVQWVLAHNPLMPAETLQTLAEDEDPNVREAGAGNERVLAVVLQAPVLDADRLGHQTAAFETYHNGQVPQPGGTEQTSMEALQALAWDYDLTVRSSVAMHAQTPSEGLRTLPQTEDAMAHSLANAIQTLLAEKPQEVSQSWMAQWNRANRHMSIMDQLSWVANLDLARPVRQMVVAALTVGWNTERVRHAFTTPADFDGRELPDIIRNCFHALAAPFLPPVALRKLAAFPLWEIRYLVALHEHTPAEVRLQLSQDGNRYVRAMARAKAEMVGGPTPQMR